MTRILVRTALFTILGSLVFALFADNSADACHRRHQRRCNGCDGGGYAYQGKNGGAYYGSGYGAPVAPYAGGVTGDAELGARSARGAIEGNAGARVDGAVRSPSDRARAGVRGDAGAPPPPPAGDTLPPPRSETPAEPSSPSATPESP